MARKYIIHNSSLFISPPEVIALIIVVTFIGIAADVMDIKGDIKSRYIYAK